MLRSNRSKIAFVVLVVVGAIGTLGAFMIHSSSHQVPAHLTYVAVGDSVAAGVGITPNETGDDACGRSTASYPNLLASKLHTSVKNFACNGATTADVSSQLDQAFSSDTPDLVTLTIGANDINWVQLIQKCAVATCGSAADSAYVDGLLNTLNTKLGDMLTAVKQRSGSATPPHVLVTGYYHPITSTECLGDRLSPTGLAWITAQTDKLNTTIRTATLTYAASMSRTSSKPLATYVPLHFDGHGICSSDPWVQGLLDPAPFHPNAAGVARIADSLYELAKQ